MSLFVDEIEISGDSITQILRAIDALNVAIQRVESKVDSLAASHAETVGHVETLVQKVEPHLAELGPMIDAIASNPMFKMLTGGKKRS